MQCFDAAALEPCAHAFAYLRRNRRHRRQTPRQRLEVQARAADENWQTVLRARLCQYRRDKLPAGTVDTLLKPENKATLTKVLTYHVVAGRLSSTELKQQIKAGHGTAMLKTVSGGTLWAMLHGDDIVLKDEKGEWSTITQANVFQSNGVIHVIDTVVLPS